MVERIRDVKVAEELAAQAGTDQTPQFVLGDVLTPVIFAPQRPALASSGYFPGFMGVIAAAVALNTSHVGIFGRGFGGADGGSIVRVNKIWIQNTNDSQLTYTIRRVDSPFTGFPSVRLTPGYINAGNPTTGGVFSVTKTDTVAAVGVAMGQVVVETLQTQPIDGPFILNDGILVVSCGTVNKSLRVMVAYEHWTAIRIQASG